jgi:hypothetical protein
MTRATPRAGRRRAGTRRALLMLLQPWAAIKSAFRKPSPSPLALCHKARREAAELYAAAQSRGDTRAEHWALRRYRRATNALSRMERESCP